MVLLRRDGKLRAAADTGSDEDRLIDEGPLGRAHQDVPLEGVPPRRCAKCGRRFQPTVRRRMLCAGCYGNADSSME